MPADFQVGEYRVQPQLNLVISPDQTRIAIEPKMMEVLVFLAGRTGEVVSKKQLLDALWSGAHVTENALTRCVAKLRKVFEDDRKHPRVIQTITKRGYRLIALVSGLAESSARFRILEQPSEEAIGGICLAPDRRLDRKVVAKTLPPGLSGDEPARRRCQSARELRDDLGGPNGGRPPKAALLSFSHLAPGTTLAVWLLAAALIITALIALRLALY